MLVRHFVFLGPLAIDDKGTVFTRGPKCTVGLREWVAFCLFPIHGVVVLLILTGNLGE